MTSHKSAVDIPSHEKAEGSATTPGSHEVGKHFRYLGIEVEVDDCVGNGRTYRSLMRVNDGLFRAVVARPRAVFKVSMM